MPALIVGLIVFYTLNESPSEKEGKSRGEQKVRENHALNESPSEKEGKFAAIATLPLGLTDSLNESPSEKEGKSHERRQILVSPRPSMKVPPKRKGN